MFKGFYENTKSSVNEGSGDFLNSARSSIGSLGGKLEQRRQAMRAKKEDTEKPEESKDNMQAESA